MENWNNFGIVDNTGWWVAGFLTICRIPLSISLSTLRIISFLLNVDLLDLCSLKVIMHDDCISDIKHMIYQTVTC